MMNTPNGMNRPQQSAQPNIPPEQLNALLGMAGKKLGRDPRQLKNQLENGQLGQVLSGLDPQKAAQVNQILNNPQQLEQLLNSPKVKGLLNSLMGPR